MRTNAILPALIFFSAGCVGTSGPEPCGSACGREMPETGDDPIIFAGRALDDFSNFFEPVEVVRWGDRVAVCSGVRGLVVYRAEDPTRMRLLTSLRPDP
ncbi:MAG: hypothetical protein AAF449_10585, partial [Myxococcota bacterium]